MATKARTRLKRKSLTWFTRRENAVLVHNVWSNFWIEPDGTHVEGEYQAEKHAGHPWRQVILLNTADPGFAKKLGRKWKLTPEELAAWDERKDAVMMELVTQKLLDWVKIRKMLKETGNEPMTEWNFWHDNYWGMCVCPRCSTVKVKRNQLGKIWMALRSQSAKEAIYDPETMVVVDEILGPEQVDTFLSA